MAKIKTRSRRDSVRYNGTAGPRNLTLRLHVQRRLAAGEPSTVVRDARAIKVKMTNVRAFLRPALVPVVPTSAFHARLLASAFALRSTMPSFLGDAAAVLRNPARTRGTGRARERSRRSARATRSATGWRTGRSGSGCSSSRPGPVTFTLFAHGPDRCVDDAWLAGRARRHGHRRLARTAAGRRAGAVHPAIQRGPPQSALPARSATRLRGARSSATRCSTRSA